MNMTMNMNLNMNMNMGMSIDMNMNMNIGINLSMNMNMDMNMNMNMTMNMKISMFPNALIGQCHIFLWMHAKCTLMVTLMDTLPWVHLPVSVSLPCNAHRDIKKRAKQPNFYESPCGLRAFYRRFKDRSRICTKKRVF